MNAQDIRRARIILARESRKHFPPGAVRECRQWSDLGGTDYIWRWDFAWRDPASGNIRQYHSIMFSVPDMPEEDFAERIRQPALACLEREVHRKCGMDYAIANQHQLPLPSGVLARFV